MDLDLLDEHLENVFIDIRSVQRNGKKHITTVEGLALTPEQLKEAARDLRKLLNTSCSVDDNNLKMSGNDHTTIINYLKKKFNYTKFRINGVDL